MFTLPRHRPRVNQMMVKRVMESAELEKALRALPPVARRLAEEALPVLVQRSDLEGLASAFMPRLVERLGDLGEMLRKAQGEALIGEPPPETPRVSLESLVWSTRRKYNPTYILGDVAAVASFDDALELRHPFDGAGTLRGIFLPISSRVLLIGASPTAAIPDDETINLASAELSRHFFVSEETSEREMKYFRRLAARSAISDQARIERWIEEFLQAETDGGHETA